jgi:sec-independent protein translocase protein TatA
MFGVGYQEMLLIGLAALLLFGPGKMPEMMSQAGKWYKQFRDITSDLTGEFNKTVAEAKGELDSLGIDLGPMQKQVNSITKSVQKDLGGTAGKKTTTTTGKGTTTSGASSKAKTGTAAKATPVKSTSSRTSGSAASGSKTNVSKPNMTSGKPVGIASKDDPFAGVSLFEQTERKPRRRARSATPAAFTDPTPRDIDEVEATASAVEAPVSPTVFDADDPLARARQRRLKAGYAQATA